MAKQQDPNSLGAMMAAQNELNGINAARLQNSQEEQAFLQQQQAANAVMMQAAQIGASGGLGQQVGAMNPQTQAILAQYGVNAAPMPGKTTTSNKVSQSGGNIKIENKTTTNNDVKVINAGTGGASGEAGNQAKFQTWLSNAFAKQQTDYEVQRRVFARRDRDLEKQSNKMMRELEKTNKGLSEKLSPESWQKTQGNQLKTVLTVLMLTLAPLIVKPIAEGIEKIKEFFTGKDGKVGFSEAMTEAMGVDKSKGETIVDGLKNVFSDLKDGLIEYFNLLIEERVEAIQSVWNDKNLDWEDRLIGVVRAGFSGLKGAASTVSSDLREDAKKTLTSKGIVVNSQSAENSLIKGNTGTGIGQEFLTVTGGLKSDAMSTFAASSSVTNLMNSSDGHTHTAEVAEAMQMLKSVARKNGEVCLGNLEQAKKFFLSWGALDAFDLFLNEKYLIPKEYSIVYYQEKEDIKGASGQKLRTTTYDHSTLVEKGKENTIKGRTDIKFITLYFLTKEGFKALEESIGGEGFKFDGSSDHIVYKKNLERQMQINPGVIPTDVDHERLQYVTELQQAARSYDEARDNVDWGTVGAVGEVIQDSWSENITPIINSIGNYARNGLFRFKEIIGTAGKYPNTEEGRKKFISDLTQVYAKELYDYYKSCGYSDAEAREQAARVAGFLVTQDAIESGYGTNTNSGQYNYGNLTASEGQRYKNGKDKDAEGNTISQKFRVFNNASEYVQEKIKLLSGARQYKGSLNAKTFSEFLGILQQGYDGKGGAGKYAESKTYIQDTLKVGEDTLPQIEEAIKSFTEEGAGVEQTPTGDNSATQNKIPYMELAGNRIYFNENTLSTLKNGGDIFKAISGITQVDSAGVEKVIQWQNWSKDEKDNLSRMILENFMKDTPEIYSSNYKEGSILPGIKIGVIKKSEMSQKTRKSIEETNKRRISGKGIEELQVNVCPSITGITFEVYVTSLYASSVDALGEDVYTGNVYRRLDGRLFPPLFYILSQSEQTDNDPCPPGTNPLFYYMVGLKQLPKRIERAINRLSALATTGQFNEKDVLVGEIETTNLLGNSKMKQIRATEDELNTLTELGLIAHNGLKWNGKSTYGVYNGQFSSGVVAGRDFEINYNNLLESGKIHSGVTIDSNKKPVLEFAKAAYNLVDSLLGGVLEAPTLKPTETTEEKKVSKTSEEQYKDLYSNTPWSAPYIDNSNKSHVTYNITQTGGNEAENATGGK